MKSLYFILICFLSYSSLLGQEVISLTNPSFEDFPAPGQAPEGWVNCGFNEESATDILPGLRKTIFGVRNKAYDGLTYVGMVARDNDTWESLGQQLPTAMQRDSTYRFSLFLAQSERYESISKRTNQPVDYILPTVLKLWGGKGECKKNQLLGETEVINHLQWYEYTFEFTAESDWDFFLIEVYYQERKEQAYCGHVLIDYCSDIKMRPWYAAPIESQDLTVINVKKRIELCKQNNIKVDKNGELLSHTLFLDKVFRFEGLARSMGIRQYIMSRPLGEISVSIRCLEKLEAKDLAAMLKAMARIHLKNQNEERLTDEEVHYFENAEELFSQTLKESELESMLEEYIELNANALSLELKSCY